MLIRVTEEDIRNGKRQRADRCPIALAASRETGLTILVGKEELCRSEQFSGQFSEQIKLPPEAVRFVSEFDSGGSPLPFEFELSPEDVMLLRS